MLELRLLGSPQILLNGQTIAGLPAKSQALLFYQALSGRPQTRLALAGLLWPDKREADALANLRQALHHLRNALPDYLEISRSTIALNQALPCQIDVLRFEQESSERNAIDVHRAAVDRYTGDFLAGFYVEEAEPFEQWAVVMRERLHQVATQSLQQLVTHFVSRRATAAGLRYTNQWLTLEPWREEAHRQKLRLLAWAGQRQAALEHYERCRQILAEELGAAPEAETMALYEQIRTGQFDSGAKRGEGQEPPPLSPLYAQLPLPALARTATPPHNLPTHRTPLIGREAQITHICQIVSNPAHRLITLAGPGGMGKTQLALAVAQAMLEVQPLLATLPANGTQTEADAQSQPVPFPDGVWFVPLAGVTRERPDEVESLVNAILLALPVTPTGRTTPRQQLVNYLRPRHVLLVLDHFDPLPEAAALLTSLLQAAPHLSLFVTAQTELRLEIEVVLPLTGLPTPARDDDPQAVAYSSIRLFRERAGRIFPTFALAGETLRSVIRICQLVAGLPLAIEMVASLTPHLSCAAIEQAIRLQLTALEKAAPAGQHASLQAVYECVWQRLPPMEQAALAGATVFPGSFTRAAFLAVTKARLTDLVSLHDRALFQQDGVGRSMMPASLRQFASQKLDALPGNGEDVRNRHSEYYANFLQACEPALKTADLPQAMAVIRLEIHHIQAMWQRAIARHHLPTLEKVQESLWSFYYLQGRHQEGEALFAAAATALRPLVAISALATSDLATSDLATSQSNLIFGQVLNWQAWFQIQLGRYAEALTVVQESLARFAQASHERMHRVMAYAQLAAGSLHLLMDEPDLAHGHLTQGFTHAQECGDPWGQAYCALLLGPLALPAPQFRRFATHYSESLATLRTLGDPLLLTNCLLACAHTALALGEYDQAATCLQESQQISQDVGLPDGLLATHLALGELYRARGQVDEAHAIGLVCFHHCVETGNERSLTMVLHNLGLVACDGERYAEAKAYLQESLRIAERIGCRSAVVMALTAAGYVALALGEGEQARTNFQTSYTAAQQLPRRTDLVAAALGGLAAADAASSAYPAAAANYQQALTLAAQIEAPPLICDLLVGLSMVRWQTGAANPDQIADWLALACQHPASTQATKARATQLLAQVQTTLSIPQPMVGQASGAASDWRTMVATILKAA